MQQKVNSLACPLTETLPAKASRAAVTVHRAGSSVEETRQWLDNGVQDQVVPDASAAIVTTNLLKSANGEH